MVLATGGYGQVFASTSNPPAVTGDGVAIAMRAGLDVSDVEFVQFHPTVMWSGPDAAGQQALVSEAVRGEGAILYDGAGRRVMAGVHPQEDLAPRDVVAAAISRTMAEAPGGVGDHVYLDATAMGERFYERFPSITAACRSIGVDPARDRIPVAPAAHYACGGVPAQLDGTTALPGSTPSARCPAPASTAPTAWRRTASPRASSPAPDSAATSPGSCPAEAVDDGDVAAAARSDRPRPQDDDPHGDVASRRRAPRRRRARRGRRGASTAIVAGTAPGCVAPSQAAYEATNVATVASARARRRRGAHREPRLPPAPRPPRADGRSG